VCKILGNLFTLFIFQNSYCNCETWHKILKGLHRLLLLNCDNNSTKISFTSFESIIVYLSVLSAPGYTLQIKIYRRHWCKVFVKHPCQYKLFRIYLDITKINPWVNLNQIIRVYDNTVITGGDGAPYLCHIHLFLFITRYAKMHVKPLFWTCFLFISLL
jgi:hypothetical protein